MVAFALVEDGADRCLGGIDRKRQLGIGTGEGQRCRLGKTGFQPVQRHPIVRWTFLLGRLVHQSGG